MTMKEKYLLLWVFLMMAMTFAMHQFAGHVAPVLENLVAVALPASCIWS
jgi:hypothetical protein